MTSYEEVDNRRREYHEWLKSRVSLLRADSQISDKRLFVLLDAMLLETGFLLNDITDKTKTLSDLWIHSRAMGNALVFLAKEVEQIKPMAEQIKKFEKPQQEVLSMKEQIDSRVKQRAEQIQNEIQHEKEKVDKDLPGVA